MFWTLTRWVHANLYPHPEKLLELVTKKPLEKLGEISKGRP